MQGIDIGKIIGKGHIDFEALQSYSLSQEHAAHLFRLLFHNLNFNGPDREEIEILERNKEKEMSPKLAEKMVLIKRYLFPVFGTKLPELSDKDYEEITCRAEVCKDELRQERVIDFYKTKKGRIVLPGYPIFLQESTEQWLVKGLKPLSLWHILKKSDYATTQEYDYCFRTGNFQKASGRGGCTCNYCYTRHGFGETFEYMR